MEAVSARYGEDKENIRETMTKMLDCGIIRQERKFLPGGKQLKALYLNEEKLSDFYIIPEEKLLPNEKIRKENGK